MDPFQRRLALERREVTSDRHIRDPEVMREIGDADGALLLQETKDLLPSLSCAHCCTARAGLVAIS